jgi:hypothetical protein
MKEIATVFTSCLPAGCGVFARALICVFDLHVVFHESDFKPFCGLGRLDPHRGCVFLLA